MKLIEDIVIKIGECKCISNKSINHIAFALNKRYLNLKILHLAFSNISINLIINY